jgi:hypothetical protein
MPLNSSQDLDKVFLLERTKFGYSLLNKIREFFNKHFQKWPRPHVLESFTHNVYNQLEPELNVTTQTIHQRQFHDSVKRRINKIKFQVLI